MAKIISEVVDGVRIERPMTEEEEIAFEAANKADALAIAKLAQEKADREAKRQSALAKLATLGLTEDEIAAL